MERTILIVEDDTDLSEALAEMLRAAGYNVITSDNSETALVVIQKMKPDLIVLDLFTYSIHGIHFLERLRSEEAVKETRVIVLTNIEHEKHKERALELGVIDYLIKAKTSLAKVTEIIKNELPANK